MLVYVELAHHRRTLVKWPIISVFLYLLQNLNILICVNVLKKIEELPKSVKV